MLAGREIGFTLLVLAVAAALAPAGCGSSNGTGSSNSAVKTGQGADGGASSSGGSSSSSGGGSGSGSSGGTPASGTTVDGGVPVPGNLPAVPAMTNVTALVRGNSARIMFDPVPGAVDYRVYAAPADGAVHVDSSSGALDYIDNATYRCAGYRSVDPIQVDNNDGPAGNQYPAWIATTTSVDGQSVEGYTRKLADATIGYAFPASTAGTVPIYAVGDPAPDADNYGYGMREIQTRRKLYVTDNSSYLAKGWRDDGVAFYAPASASSTACGGGTPVQISTQTYTDSGGTVPVYFAPGAEATARAGMKGSSTPAFFLCPTQQTGLQPVMRVAYTLAAPAGLFGDSDGHDELTLGQERFDRARCQGNTTGACASVSQVLWEVHWSNIAAPTELIVEALDAGCPFQGLVGVQHLPATLDPLDSSSPATEVVSTFAELQAAAPHGEVYLNGQFDGNPTPHPIARAALMVSPQTRPAMDWDSHFATSAETFTETLASDGTPNCGFTQQLIQESGTDDKGCDGSHHLASATYDAIGFDQTAPVFSLGTMQGELWSDFTTGEFRFSPHGVTATMSDTTFLHVAMEASSFTTDRRYPQIVVSTQDFMTSEWLIQRSSVTPNKNVQPVLFMQPFDAGPGRMIMEIELCNEREWAVNDHCPWFLLDRQDQPSDSQLGTIGAHPEPHDHLQNDDSARFDVYLSTKRAYVFFEDQPYACADIADRATTDPSGATITPPTAPPPAGTVSVGFGDVHYHPAAESGELGTVGPFNINHMFMDTVRHYDYVGWKSGVPAPTWDETRFPCIKQMHQGGNAGPQSPESD
ncbi:MAG TPA: hypothetical protein VK762_22685 [Polyangiaceae bacterium]|nr:hypothetical protein [Polyangiaceae bacterium]